MVYSRGPNTVTIRATQQQKQVMNIHCSTDDGELIQMALWSPDVERLRDSIVFNAVCSSKIEGSQQFKFQLVQFDNIKAVAIRDKEFHKGKLPVEFSASSESQATLLVENYVLQGPSLSTIADIDHVESRLRSKSLSAVEIVIFETLEIDGVIVSDFRASGGGMFGEVEMRDESSTSPLRLHVDLREVYSVYRNATYFGMGTKLRLTGTVEPQGFHG